MKKLTHHEIRIIWIQFFKSKGHALEPSASLIPHNDPTLLWINSGVAALKKYFDGREIPKNKRIVNIQKSLRTNDIENVGQTARHHTFFEMMGNFSIGDYFRAEVIPWAYELLTDAKYFAIPIQKLYFTYYPDDTETKELWEKCGVPKDHIIPLEGNFWEIGEGPCGPDTEIFFDRGSKYDARGPELIANDIDNERYVEIWNIVFSQFNAKEGLARSEYKELPSRNIDTGAGLERFALIMQECESNYETDLFKPIIDKLYAICQKDIKANQKAYRVIADHMRTVVFALSDGAAFSNLGRGYVLRRILRRTVKYARTLGINEPFLGNLVDVVVDNMKDFYPYLSDNKEIVKKLIKTEEMQFFATIAKGEIKLQEMIAGKTLLSGEDAFTLYDTYGFPIELSLEYCEEAGISVDQEGFKHGLAQQKEQSKKARNQSNSMSGQNEAFMQFTQESTFVGYTETETVSTVIGVFEEGVVLDITPFYAESGGQEADSGLIDDYEVKNVIKMPNKQHLHILDSFDLKVGDTVRARIDTVKRGKIRLNHTATHLLQYSLKQVLGSHVAQAGSFVGDKLLRFDFNHFSSPKQEELIEIEDIVNQLIANNDEVMTEIKDIKAISADTIALFGEKYEEQVRVVSAGLSKELCGGTHASKTGDLIQFGIYSCESIGSGVYRITAKAGSDIKAFYDDLACNLIAELEATVNREMDLIRQLKQIDFPKLTKVEVTSYKDIINIHQAIKMHKDLIKDYQKKLQEIEEADFLASIKQYKSLIEDNKLIIKVDNISIKLVKLLADTLFEDCRLDLVFIATTSFEKASFVCKSRHNKANEYIKLAAKASNGSGGGRGDFASGGGDASLVDMALLAIKEVS